MIEALGKEKEEIKSGKPLSLSTLMPISQGTWMVCDRLLLLLYSIDIEPLFTGYPNARNQ